MTTPATNPNQSVSAGELAGYDPTGHQRNILVQVDPTTIVTDATTGLVYGKLASTAIPAGSNLVGSVSPVDGQKATYRYAIQATAPYSSATDWIVLRGSATKTIRVTHIELSGAATAATEVIMLLKKHTVANTG